MENNQYQHIPQEKFAFAQLDADLKDKKLETKARGYMADAMLRFKKNKSSVVAAYIILLLVLFVIVSPILSPYQVKHMDKLYMNHPPFVRSVAEKKLGILDGGITRTSQNDAPPLHCPAGRHPQAAPKAPGIPRPVRLLPVLPGHTETSPT